jgi:O-antigen polymerase
MRNSKIIFFLVLFILISSFLSTLVKLHLYIHALPYVLIAFGISFLIVFICYSVQLKKKKIEGIEINLLTVCILVFVIYLFIRYLTSPLYNSQPDKILFFICLAVGYILIVQYVKGRENHIVNIIYSIILAGLFQLTYTFLRLSGIIPGIFHSKLGGTFGNSGDLANFIAIVYVLSLGLFFYEKKKVLRYLLLVSVIMNLLFIVVSLSRTSWIVCFVASLIIIYYSGFSHINFRTITVRSKYLLASISFLIILTGVWGSFELYSLRPSSADGRLFIWKNCLHLIKDRPLFGHGYESFLSEIRQTQLHYFKNNPTDIKNGLLADDIFFAYNDYLQITVEYGIIGLAIFLFIIFRTFSFKNPDEIGIGLSIIRIIRVTLFAILISMLFSYPLKNPTILICFFILLSAISVFDKVHLTKIKLKRLNILVGVLAGCIFLYFLIINALNSFTYGLKWKKAYEVYERHNGNFVAQYVYLFPALKKDKSFIMNYGYILFNSGNYDKCINIYETYGYLCLSSFMYQILGESYEKTKNYLKAVENYENASFMIPHLFMPKYKLFELYIVTSQTHKADSIARQISMMKIKVYSDEVREIKTEINKYLFSKRQAISNE